MDFTAFFDTLFSTQTPVLPQPVHVFIARHLSWAIVLAFFCMVLARRWPKWLQLGLAGLLFVWTLIPGPVSPAFWLGLAFQMPSLMSTVICTTGLLMLLRTDSPQPLDATAVRALQWAGLGGIVLGWLLLLDTFAVLPLSLYSIGFSPAALGVLLLLALFPWMVFGTNPARVVSILLASVLLLHVLSRLPTGNVWDALIDPWLWIALQFSALRLGVRRLAAAWRARAAIRA